MKTAAPLRGTQSLVGQMGWVFARPSLTLIEAAWRWLFGIPALIACWLAVSRILAALPLETTGLAGIDFTNPWVASVRAASAWALYRPHVVAALPGILAPAAMAWAVLSGLGRNLLLRRMQPGLRFRPAAFIVLQAAWLALWLLVLWAYLESVGWASATHITVLAEPDLIGYTIWLIFLSLGFFALWALASWPFAMAPLIMLLEKRSALSALGQSFRLGRAFTSKLVETNLVMGIVKLALIVLAMVFSAVLIPFSDEIGLSAIHLEWSIVLIFYFVASDYFHVVRLKGYIEFWRTFRGGEG